MEQLSIRQIAAWTKGTYDGPDMRVSGVAINSRKAGRGDLFLPLRGALQDGVRQRSHDGPFCRDQFLG